MHTAAFGITGVGGAVVVVVAVQGFADAGALQAILIGGAVVAVVAVSIPWRVHALHGFLVADIIRADIVVVATVLGTGSHDSSTFLRIRSDPCGFFVLDLTDEAVQFGMCVPQVETVSCFSALFRSAFGGGFASIAPAGIITTS